MISRVTNLPEIEPARSQPLKIYTVDEQRTCGAA